MGKKAAAPAAPKNKNAQRAELLKTTAAPQAPQMPPPAQTGAGGLDWSEFDRFVQEANQHFGGSSGGGGYSSYSGAWGGGGGGAAQPTGGAALPPDIASDQSQLMHVDPRYQQQLDQLSAEAQGMQGKLVDLDPETQALIDRARDSQLTRSRQVFSDQRDDFLTRMFAGGTNQSTIAGDIGGRLIENQALVESDIEGQSADRSLSLRSDLTDKQRELLGMRMQIAQGSQDAALRELGINVDQLERGRDRREDMWKANLASQTDIATANIGAGAQVSAASIGAEANRFGSLADLYSNVLKNKESARQFDAGYSLDRDRLSLDQTKSDRDYDLGLRDISVRRAGINAENQRYYAGLGFEKDKYSQDSAFRDREFAEDTRRYDQGYALDREKWDEEKRKIEKELYFRDKELTYGHRKAIVGSVGSIIGAFMSDERLKNDIRPVDLSEQLARLRAVEWEWKLGGERGLGVIAQEVADIFPEAVVDSDGFLAVRYDYLVALLLESHRDLLRRLEAR